MSDIAAYVVLGLCAVSIAFWFFRTASGLGRQPWAWLAPGLTSFFLAAGLWVLMWQGIQNWSDHVFRSEGEADWTRRAIWYSGMLVGVLSAMTVRSVVLKPHPPVIRLAGLLTSTWFGVSLLVILFVYSSIGSALPFVRQKPFFEMTELEWFCWWPFGLLIFIMCLNILIVTIRRIPLTPVSLGAWIIHAGVLVLCIGSVWYFGFKVEGDSPLVRRRITVALPGTEPASFPAIPNAGAMAGDDQYRVSVFEIQPEWELPVDDSTTETARRAFKVTLLVQSPEQSFLRELYAGMPELTQDLVETGQMQPPVDYAMNVLGRPLADEAVDIRLDYESQRYFYVSNSSAVYLREVGSDQWVQRPIRRLPRFNDRISSPDNVWIMPGDEDTPRLGGLQLAVPPANEEDPLPGVVFTITDYLRYAVPRSRYVSGGDQLNPVVEARLETSDGRSSDSVLAAFDPARNMSSEGLVAFVWVGSEAERQELAAVRPPELHIAVPEHSVDLRTDIPGTVAANPDLGFTEIEGTDYSYRVLDTRLNQSINETTLSVVFVEIKRGDEQFLRWVFDDPDLSRDYPLGGGMGHSEELEFDEGIRIEFIPGRLPPAPITLIGGPQPDDLSTLVAIESANPSIAPTVIGENVELREGVFFTVTRYSSFGRDERRPMIVPRSQRVRDAGVLNSQINISVPDGPSARTTWLSFNSYVFRDASSALRRYPYKSSIISLSDGRQIELLYSRRRMELPSPAVLDDFVIDSHIGGFTGETTSIRNWTSVVRFGEDVPRSAPVDVSVNAPASRDGFWYFQSSWDPPEQADFHGQGASNGLNYTILGVANRPGVLVQLTGCCMIVVGLIYAFYIKPIIRRRLTAAYAGEATS